jgi:hypothetical protein
VARRQFQLASSHAYIDLAVSCFRARPRNGFTFKSQPFEMKLDRLGASQFRLLSALLLISTRIALSGLSAQAHLWSEYAIAFASDSSASSRSVGTPKLSNRSVTRGFSQISMLRQSSPPSASLSRRFAIFTVCPK